MLVSALNPERDATGSSLVQVMLTLQNNPLPALKIPGLSVEFVDIYTGRALYDLAIELQERAGRLVGWFDYDSDLFEAGTIARMAGHFRTLLEGSRRGPRHPGRLAAHSYAKTRFGQLIETGSGPLASYPRDACVHQLVEAQAARVRHRDRRLVGEECLSYGELNCAGQPAGTPPASGWESARACWWGFAWSGRWR